MKEYKCIKGHDRCDQMYPSESCPYCEVVVSKATKKKNGGDAATAFHANRHLYPDTC